MRGFNGFLHVLLMGLALSSCGRHEKPQAALESGFPGNDCASARMDLEIQAPKLAETGNLFREKFTAYAQQEGISPYSGELVRSEADCNDKLLRNPGTASASSVFQDVYQRCVDFYRMHAIVAAREAKLATSECRQGADLGVVTPVFISSCDIPCAFTDVECGVVHVDVDQSSRRFACGTIRAAMDAARGYCREFNLGEDRCRVGEGLLMKGRDLATSQSVLAGVNVERLQLSLTAIGAAVASAEYIGGTVVNGEGRVEFKALGLITLEHANDQRAIKAGEFVAPGTRTSCKLSLTGFATASARAFLGVGGSFGVFGNGATARVGAEGKFELMLSRALESNLGLVDGGGLDAQVVIERCVPLAQAWLRTNLASEFRPFAEAFAHHVEEFRNAADRATRAVFSALSRPEESVVTQGRIYCAASETAAFGGSKTYRINRFFASVSTGRIGIRIEYEGSINPFSSTTTTFFWDMTGHARGEQILRDLADRGLGSLSDSDIRWLLTGLRYSGDYVFTDCNKTGF